MSELGRSFDSTADDYEAARPGYPAELLDALPLSADAHVLDLGAGTGKLTRLLVRRYRRVTAVEPLAGMRAILERAVPEAESHAGHAEDIPLPDASVDAVFAAQAFHWFANDGAIAEIARVLRPGGAFAVIRNDTIEPFPLPEAYRQRIDSLLDEVKSIDCEHAYAAIGRGPFGPLQQAAVEHRQVQTRESTLAFMRSVSVVARLPDAEREAVMEELGALVPEGEYVFPMRATVRWAVRL